MGTNIISYLIGASLGVIAILCLFSYWDARDAAQAETEQAYTTCVKSHFDMTPQAYVAEFGHFPDCQ